MTNEFKFGPSEEWKKALDLAQRLYRCRQGSPTARSLARRLEDHMEQNSLARASQYGQFCSTAIRIGRAS